MSPGGPTFPLIARRRVAGIPFGGMRSSRRGPGFDLAGSRPYRPGDDFRLIDRHASARLSSMLGSDELVVREHLTEEAIRVAVVVDRRPSMALFPDELPWLSKPAAIGAARALISESAAIARAPVDDAGGDELGFRAPEDCLDRAVAGLAARERPLAAGSFVFLLSDFLSAPSGRSWAAALARRWDVVPVVVQDPTWEQSFPDVAGAVLPLADPRTGRLHLARLSRAEVAARRRESEARLRATLEGFRALGLDWVLVSASDPGRVLEAFLAWAAGRERRVRLT